MAEYINRAELISNLKEFANEQLTTLIENLIQKQPTADVESVVRCRDCKYYSPYESEGCEGQGECLYLLGLEFCVEDKFFCSYGKMKDGDKE